MTEKEKKDSNIYLLHVVEEFKKKNKVTNFEVKAYALDFALCGWRACLDWLEENGVDVSKAFKE